MLPSGFPLQKFNGRRKPYCASFLALIMGSRKTKNRTLTSIKKIMSSIKQMFARDKTWSLKKTPFLLNEEVKNTITVDMLKEDENSPFNFEVRKEKVFFGEQELTDKRLIVDNSGKPLSVVGKDYGIVQPSNFVDIIENSFDGTPFKVESALTLYDRRRMLLTVDLLDGDYEVVPGDKMRSRVMFLSSFDGSWGLSWRDIATRLACTNELPSKIHDVNIMDSTKHSRLILERIPNFSKSLQSILERRKVTYSAMTNLASHSVTLEEADRIIAGFVGVKTPRAWNVKESIVNLFRNGQGNKGETLWDVNNAVTEHFTHHSVGEKVEDRELKQALVSQFGTASKKKVDFFDILTDEEEIDFSAIEELANKGDRLLKERERELVKVR